jgi:hypothetical protein
MVGQRVFWTRGAVSVAGIVGTALPIVAHANPIISLSAGGTTQYSYDTLGQTSIDSNVYSYSGIQANSDDSNPDSNEDGELLRDSGSPGTLEYVFDLSPDFPDGSGLHV